LRRAGVAGRGARAGECADPRRRPRRRRAHRARGLEDARGETGNGPRKPPPANGNAAPGAPRSIDMNERARRTPQSLGSAALAALPLVNVFARYTWIWQ